MNKVNKGYIETEVNIGEESKLFSPNLSPYYLHRYYKTIEELLKRYPGEQRIAYLNAELDFQSKTRSLNNIDQIKFMSSISILKDLLSQGWRMGQTAEKHLTLAPPPTDDNENKLYVRQRLQKERNAQLSKSSIKNFIQKMEKGKDFKGNKLNILSLVGDRNKLIEGIKQIKNEKTTEYEKLDGAKQIIKPYLQLVTNERCNFTGYKLNDIWRYFRYTWSIPYNSTPGRNMYYLVRDAGQPFHPVIGIFALGNSVLHLTNRDNYIGWTLEYIKEALIERTEIQTYEELPAGLENTKKNVTNVKVLESKEENSLRVKTFSSNIMGMLKNFIDDAIGDINPNSLVDQHEIENPTKEIISRLNDVAEKLRNSSLLNNNKRSRGKFINWKEESETPLFTKKRAKELANLLSAKLAIRDIEDIYNDDELALKKLISFKGGKIINIALQANRKKKIGSNMMEIIVCGSIPPYNEILGGKLVSILACSPTVINNYNERYKEQISEIASRMKGETVIRDSRLAFLGTTSLYEIGSSQYNRIKVKNNNSTILEFKKLGITEGFGSVFFTEQTSSLIGKMLQAIEGGRKINNVFGEGTSPKLRLIRSGLSALGIPESFTKHHTKRIVYGVELASNTLSFLRGETEQLNYLIPNGNKAEIYTNELIEYWIRRWFLSRIESVNIIERLKNFDKGSLVVSHFI